MEDLSPTLRTELAGRYEIERELGRGGMAVVYLAQDVRHGRRVALKVLRQDVGDSSTSDRFHREVRTVAQFHHPHILSLYDSGAAAGELYFVMPFVEGETLRALLERTGPLPLEEAVQYAREIADALEYSHARGIMHRDIKPENVFISSGHALVGDFGIARAVDPTGQRITETGLAVGTPNYMSPEQATADAHIDGRADQYALACVLYEMLSGAPPFNGNSSRATIARHLADPVPSLQTVRQVPAALEEAMLRALAKVPADRFPSARTFSDALVAAVPVRTATTPIPAPTERRSSASRARLVLIAAAVVLLAVSVWIIARSKLGPTAAAAEKPLSVAVLPFEFSGDSARAIYADGLAEGLISGLVRADLSVPDPGRTFQYRGSDRDPREIGRELDVNAIVSAQVRISGNALRVTARLTDVREGRLLWTGKFDGVLSVDGGAGELFAVQDSMSERILSELLPELDPTRRAAVVRGVLTYDLRAYEAFLEGRKALRNVSLEGAETAERHFRTAVERDPGFVDAWIGLATATDQLLQLSGRSPTALITGLQGALERASALDSAHPELILQRARARLFFEYEWSSYDREMRRGLLSYPNYAPLHFAYGQNLHMMGLADSGLAELQRASSLEPSNVFMLANIAAVLAAGGRTDEALPLIRRVIALDSTQWMPHLDLAIIASHAGRDGEAALEVAKAVRLMGDSPWIAGFVIQCSVHADPRAARAARDRLLARAQSEYVQHVFLAQAHLGVGARETALAELEASLNLRDRDLITSLGWGVFEALKGEPRYEAILRRTAVYDALREPTRVRSRGANRGTCRT